LNFLVAKSDADRQGRTITATITNEQENDLANLQVEIVDGYHRFGALMLLSNNPYELVERKMDVDWAAVSLRYPDWAKADR
jgi:hypothetical protein